MPPLPEQKNKAAAGRLDAASRRHTILELRRAGASQQQIADQVGISQRQVSTIIHKAIEKLAKIDGETAELVRKIELQRLDEMQMRLWPKIKAGNDPWAFDKVLKIMAHRAKLLGLEAPQKVQVLGRIEHDHQIDDKEVKRMEDAWRNMGGDVIDGEVLDDEPVALLEGANGGGAGQS